MVSSEIYFFLLVIFYMLIPFINHLPPQQALMLENLQKTSTPHVGLQPNSQVNLRGAFIVISKAGSLFKRQSLIYK